MGETENLESGGDRETEDAPVSVRLERQAKAVEVLSGKDESFWAETLGYRGDSED